MKELTQNRHAWREKVDVYHTQSTENANDDRLHKCQIM